MRGIAGFLERDFGTRRSGRLFGMLAAGLMLAGCGGAGDGGDSSPFQPTTVVRGIILETAGNAQTKVAENVTIAAEMVTAEKSGLAKTDLPTTQTNSDGSFEIPEVPVGAAVILTMSKEGYTLTKKEVAVSGVTYAVASLQKRNETAATLTPSGGTVTTDGSALEVPAGALSADVPNITLTSYHTVQNLPVPLPDGTTPLVGADVSAPTEVVFNPGFGAPFFTELPPNNVGDLQNADIRLFEFTADGWQERPGKGILLTTGARAGFLGPDPLNPATLSGLFPAVYALKGILPGTLTGTVRDPAGTPLPGVYVFGGGALGITDSNGNYRLDRVSVLREGGEKIPLIAAAFGFLANTQAATLAPGGSATVDFILTSLSQIPEIGPDSVSLAIGTIRVAITSALSNTAPLAVDIVQNDIVLGTFSLDPGESVFVIVITNGDFSIFFAVDVLVLSGAVDFDAQGQASTVDVGQRRLFLF